MSVFWKVSIEHVVCWNILIPSVQTTITCGFLGEFWLNEYMLFTYQFLQFEIQLRVGFSESSDWTCCLLELINSFNSKFNYAWVSWRVSIEHFACKNILIPSILNSITRGFFGEFRLNMLFAGTYEFLQSEIQVPQYKCNCACSLYLWSPSLRS